MDETIESRAVIVVDAPEELQLWVDAVIASGRAGGRGWPPPSHAGPLPQVVLSVGQVWRMIQRGFKRDGDPWSISRDGLPLLEVDGVNFGGAFAPDPLEMQDPDSGSVWHNLAHAALGNFH
jgi:hypothetical protein